MESIVHPALIGIPYKLGGKDMRGADCIGVVTMWLRAEGFDVNYDDGHGPVNVDWWEKSPRRFMEALLEVGSVVRFQDLRKYDLLLLFGNQQCIYPSSLAVMIDDRHILGSNESRGSFVEMLSMSIKDRFWGAIRLHGAEEKWA